MTPDMKADMAQEYATRALYASLHTAAPGNTGAGELTSAGREPLTWNVGDADGQIVSDPITFTLVGDELLTDVGIWSDDPGGDFLDSFTNDVPVSAGSYTITLSYTQT